VPEREWRRRPRPHPQIAPVTHGRVDARSAHEADRPEILDPERPLFAVVSIADQRISIYNHRGLVDSSAISTGMNGHPTPKGLFTIIGRERYHSSNIYSGAPMPFMQRITWSGIAMHLGVVPGHPASHGCIRLPAAFAVKLWGLTRIGERVVISPEDVTPSEFEHPLLPTPKTQVEAASDGASSAVGSPRPLTDAAEPRTLNPRQYAEQLKAKATAEAAAAAKAAKEAVAALSREQRDAARTAVELKTAEAAEVSAQMRADASAKAYDTAGAAANARREDSEKAAAELENPDANALDKAKGERLAKAYEAATAAKDAAASARTNAGAALAEATARLEAARAASSGKATEAAEAAQRASAAAAASSAASSAEKEAARRLAPISVLVSKKDRRIYVRQGLAPLFDAPINVRDPETPLGSHLYIATAVKDDGLSLEWSVVSMPTQLDEEQKGRMWKTAFVEDVASPPRLKALPSSPAEALERVEIPAEARERIAERLWTGGSLIVTDEPLSGETGNIGTDLTVKLRR
jgi:hypothetical protein